MKSILMLILSVSSSFAFAATLESDPTKPNFNHPGATIEPIVSAPEPIQSEIKSRPSLKQLPPMPKLDYEAGYLFIDQQLAKINGHWFSIGEQIDGVTLLFIADDYIRVEWQKTEVIIYKKEKRAQFSSSEVTQ